MGTKVLLYTANLKLTPLTSFQMNLVYFPCISICGPSHEIILMLAKERKFAFARYVPTKVIYLTIIPRARRPNGVLTQRS